MDKNTKDILKGMPRIIADCVASPGIYGAVSTAHLLGISLPEKILIRCISAQLTEAMDFCKQDDRHRRLLPGFEMLMENLNRVKEEMEKNGLFE